MEDLLRSQIKDNCKLALPNGTKELMSDISREVRVIREQPKKLYKFITQYLSSLLITRENIYIASRICRELCQNTYIPELKEELGFIGLDEDDIDTAMDIIGKYFEKDQVKEDVLLMRLLRKTKITEEQLEDVQKAIRIAFQRHNLNNRTLFENVSESEDENVAKKAASRTINLYKETNPTYSEYNCLKDEIKSSYEAYFEECDWKEESENEERDSIEKMNDTSSLTSINTDTANEDMSNTKTTIDEEEKIANEIDEKSGIEETENLDNISQEDNNFGKFSLTKRVKSRRKMSIHHNKLNNFKDDTVTEGSVDKVTKAMKYEDYFDTDKSITDNTFSSFTDIATTSKSIDINSKSGLIADENLKQNSVYEQENQMIHDTVKSRLSKKVKISNELNIFKE